MAVSLLLGLAAASRADDAAWTGTTDTAWTTTTNWTVAPVPGPADAATFAGAGNGNIVISLGTGVTVGDILFDTATAAGYTIGSGAVGSQTLTLAEGGAVTMNATVDANQVFNAAILLGGDAAAGSWSFDNESTAGTLFFAGTVSGGSGGTGGAKSLTIDGAGNTIISGVVGNGGASAVSLTKTGTGTLTLTATNNFTGGTTISGGTLAFANNSLGTTGPITMDGGTLRWHVGNTQDVSARLAFVAEKTATLDTNGNNVTLATALGGATSGALTKIGNGTLTLTAANAYTGATTINAGGLTLSGAAGGIAASSAINFNGGTLTLTNASGQGGVDRLGDSATITSYGGTLSYGNASGVTYAETVGGLTLSAGQFNTVLSTNMAAGSQTLTYGGLTRSGTGNTSAATFASNTALNATTNMIKVTGATATPAGRIIGPWATAGTTAAAQTDYAVFNAGGFVLPAAIAASAETTWTNAANAYTMSAATTLTATRTVTGLRHSGAAITLTQNQFNLETFGILNGGTNVYTISATSGVIRQQGTAAAPVFITTGNQAITVNASIADNTGALTLVKSGTGGTLTLNGLNTYSGGTVVNAGNLTLGATTGVFTTALGSGGVTMYGGTLDSASANVFNLTNNTLTINGDIATTATQSLYFGTGSVSLGSVAGPTRTITTTNLFTLGGVVADGSGASGIVKAGAGTLILSGASTYTGGTTITAGTISVAAGTTGSVGAITAGPLGTGPLISRGNGVGIAADGLGARTILNPLVFGNTAATNNTNFGSFTNSANGRLTFAAPVDLGQAAIAQTLTFNADTQFDGTISGVGSVVKTGSRAMIINAPATYGGGTSIAQGTLLLGSGGRLPAGTNVSVAGTQANQTSVLDLGGNSATIGTLALGSAITVNNAGANPNATGSALVTTGSGTLTLGGDLTYAATSNPFASTVAGNLALGAASRNFNVTNSNSGQSFPDLVVSANISGGAGVNLTLNGAGTVLFSGDNSYQGTTSLTAGGTLFITGANTTTGATTITNGTLVARSGGALGGSGNTAGVSVAATRSFTYNALADAPLTIGGNLAYAGAGTLGATIGAGLDSSRIAVLGDATTAAATVTVNLYGTTTSATTGGSGTYTLVRGGGAGSSLGNATYTLGKVYNNTNFTVSSTLVKSATELQAEVTTATALTGDVFWKGGLTGATGVWAASNGSTQSNWLATNDGANQPLVPGSAANLVFSTATSPTTLVGMTLGSDMTVGGLTLNNTATAFSLNADGYTLTISPAAATGGIRLNASNATGPIVNAGVALGAPQTWANFSGQTFTVNGNVANAGNALTVTGANQVTITGTYGGAAGAAGGAGGIVKNGTNTLLLQGSNTFSGGITINQGTVQFGNPSAFGTGPLTISGAGAVINSNFANLTNVGNNPVALDADLTFTGSQNLNLGTGTVTLGTAATATPTTRTISANANTLTIGGPVVGSGSTTGLTKRGNGTLVLGGQNTYSGATAVTAGTLRIGRSDAIPAGNAAAVYWSQTLFAGGNTPTLDLNGFDQTLGSLAMGGFVNGATSTVTNSNVVAPSTLTLTGGPTAFSYTTPLSSGSNPGTATISTSFLDLAGAAQTFDVADGAANPDLLVTAVVRNGSIVKTNGGQMAIQGTSTYAGTTSILGGQFQVSGNLGSINQSTAIVLGGDGILLLNNAQNQTGLDRVKDTAGITSYGGRLQFANTSSQGVVYAETVGPVAVSRGQFDVLLSTSMAGGAGASGPTNSQTLTLGGLTQSGAGVATFAANTTQPNATTNIIAVAGATQTPAGQIIGPWATTGTAAGAPQEYAVFNAAGQIVPAAIANSAETTWTDAAIAYTMGTASNAATNATLTGDRTMAALRQFGGNSTLTLNQFNLETKGLLAFGNERITINSTSGVIRQSGTAPASLYLASNTAGLGMVINAPIVDNTGALTLVKSGPNPVYLRGLNAYTGGTVLNAATTFVSAEAAGAFGTGTITFAGGTIDNDSVELPTFTNPVVIDGYAGYGGTGGRGLVLGGAVSLGTAPGAWRTIGVGGSGRLIVTGGIADSSAVGSIEKTGTGNLVLAGQNTYTGDTILSGGLVRLAAGNVGGVGAITSGPVGTGRLVFNGGGVASDGFAPRTILNPIAFSGSSGNVSGVFGDGAATGLLTVSGGIDLGFAPRNIVTASDVRFDGLVSGAGGIGGGGLVKTGGGVLTLTNPANSYQGITVVSGGVLRPTVAGAIPANTNLVVASNASLGTATLDLATHGIDLTVGAVQLGGPNDIYGNNNGFNAATTSNARIDTGAATLTLGGDVTFGASQGVYPAVVRGKLALGSNNLVFNNPVVGGVAAHPARSFVIGDSSNAAPDLDLAAVVSGAGMGINKSGTGMLQLSAANTFTGGITVSAGTLRITGTNATTLPTTLSGGVIVARTADALGGTANTSPNTMAAGTRLEYVAASDARLEIGGGLAITGGANTVLGGSIGAGPATAAINVAGAATATAAAMRTNIYGLVGVTPQAATYTLIQGGAGSSLSTGTGWGINFVYNNSNFTVAAPVASATAVTTVVTPQTPITAAYWRGGLTGATQVWAASTGVSGGSSNWSLTTGGSGSTAQVLVPGAGADVFFDYAIGSTAASASPGATTLGADMSIRSLTVRDFVNTALSLAADGSTLTVGTGGINVLGTPNTGTVSIGSDVRLGGPQTWTLNANSFNPGTPNTAFSNSIFQVTGGVANAGNLLTINAAAGQYVRLAGEIAGSGGLRKIGSQGLYLAGASTYTGNTTIDYGRLYLDNSGAPGASPLGTGSGSVTVNGDAAILDLNGQTIYTTPALFLAGESTAGALANGSGTAATWNGDITLLKNATIGGNVVVAGAGAFTGGGNELTLTGSGALGTFGRVIDTGVKAVTKAGTGTWTLGTANTLTGPILVSNGTLRVGAAGAIPAANPLAVFSVGGAATLDLNGFDQSLGGLVIGAMQNGQVAAVTSSAGTGSLRLTGGRRALAFVAPFTTGLNPSTATVSNLLVDMNGGATFAVADGGGNPDLAFSPTTSLRNGSLTKTGSGQLALQGDNTYAGATNVFGGTLQLSGGQGRALASSGFVIANGGTLQLTNTQNSRLSRIGGSAPITSHGGGLRFANTAGAGITYAQSSGAVTLQNGQLDVVLTTDQSGSGNSQTLSLGGLTQSGTATVTVTSPLTGSGVTTMTGLGATRNVVNVAGATATPAGRIIGPWAVVGLGAGDLRDYAVYDASGNVVASGVANSAESTWTDSATAYSGGTTYNSALNTTLTGNRTAAALRYMGKDSTLALAGFNLETGGVLFFANSNNTISSTGGVLRQIGTDPANFFLTNGGQGNLFVPAPIADNTGALTLVRSGSSNVYLRGANTYTGGTVLNAGVTFINAASAPSFGTGTITFAGGTLNNEALLPEFTNPVVFNGFAGYAGASNRPLVFSGPISLGTAPGDYRTIDVGQSAGMVLNAAIADSGPVNSIEKTGTGNLVLAGQNTFSGDLILSNGGVPLVVDPVGTVGAITSGPLGTGRVVFNGGGLAPDGSPRTLLNPVAFGSSEGGTANLAGFLGAGPGAGRLTVAVPLDFGFAPRHLAIQGDVRFDGLLSGSGEGAGASANGGVVTAGGGLIKAGAGLLTVTNPANAYSGATAIVGGTLRPTVVGAIPAGTNLTVAGTTADITAALDLATHGVDLTIGSLNIGGAVILGNNAINTAANWSRIDTGSATLTLGGGVTYGNTGSPSTATITGKLALGTANLTQYDTGVNQYTDVPSYFARDFNVTASGGAVLELDIPAVVSGSAGLAKSGTGLLQLSGNNTYSGATVVTAGTLSLLGSNTFAGPALVTGGTLLPRSANALGGSGNTAGVTVAAGATFAYRPTSDAALVIGGNLTYTGPTNLTTPAIGRLGGAIGSTPTAAMIDVAGVATIPNVAQTIDIFGVPGAAPTTGNYTLVRAAADSSLNPATAPTLGLVYNNTNFALSSATPFTRSATALEVGITAVAPAASVYYWRGGLTGATKVWAASNGTTASNWTLATGGSAAAAQVLVPGADIDVAFVAPIGTTAASTTPSAATLGADMRIRGLLVSDFVNQVPTLNTDGHRLSIGAGGISLIAARENQALTIAPEVVLTASQTWLNDTAALNISGNYLNNALTVNGGVALGGHSLTVAAIAGNNVNINGPIAGTGGITKVGAQTLTLGAPNTYTGATTINGGTLTLSGQGGAIPASAAIAINQGRLQLTSSNVNQGLVDRLGDATLITTTGGSLYVNNSATANARYLETVGTATLSGGQFEVLLQTDASGSNSSQLLALGGLVRSGNATATFSSPLGDSGTTTMSGLDATRNVIRVAGATATPAGQIIGPWAVVGLGVSNLRDYAVFDAAGNIVPSGVTSTPETTWTNPASVYSTGTAYSTTTSTTLTGNRAVAAVRSLGRNNVLNLAGYNLETTGFLSATDDSNSYINAAGGVLRQPGTDPASLYVMNGGASTLIVTAPIVDNTGALAVVVGGGATVRFEATAANTYSGGLFVNAGAFTFNSSTAAGTGPITFAGGSLNMNTQVVLHNRHDNPITLNADLTHAGGQQLLNLGRGAVSLGTTPAGEANALNARTITVNNNVLVLGGGIADGTTVNSLAKAGAGTLWLGGTNTYTGSTTVSRGTLVLGGAGGFTGATTIGASRNGVVYNSQAGTLLARHASALGGGGNTAGVAVSVGSGLAYAATADSPLAIGGNLAVEGGTGTVLGGSIGSTPTSARIDVAGVATISNAAHTVNVYGVAGTTPASGTYTLLRGGAGSSLNPTTAPTLGLVYNNTNFTVGSLSRTATELQAAVTAATPLATAYWRGGLAGGTKVWAASNGSSASNWSLTAGGAAQGLVPGPTTDVILAASPGGNNALQSTLGADVSIRSLTINTTTATSMLQLHADGYGLTLGSGGLTITSGPVNEWVDIYPDVRLAAAQAWTINSPNNNGLRMFGNVSNQGNLFTVDSLGTQVPNFYGVISGAGGLTKNGGSAMYLQNANTYTGPTTINGGSLYLQNNYQGTSGAILGTSAITIGNGSTLVLTNAAQEAAVDRLGDATPITVFSGGLNYANTVSQAVNYAENIGPVTITGGRLAVRLTNNQTAAANSQTLVLGGLSRAGGTQTATFVAPSFANNWFDVTGLDATRNMARVAGATATPAGQIIGGWATVGTSLTQIRDFAVFDAAGNVLAANIPGSPETAWTNPANAYTMGPYDYAAGTNQGASSSVTLTADRSMAALRSFGHSQTLQLGRFALETGAILNGGRATLTVSSSGGGVIRQPGTDPGVLYLIPGNDWDTTPITLDASVVDNVGALTVVKTGDYALNLNAVNTFSGGLVLATGTTNVNTSTGTGTGRLTFAGGGIDTNAGSTNLTLARNNPVTIDTDFGAGVGTNNALNLGAGAVSLGAGIGPNRTVSVFNSFTLTLGGEVADGTVGNAITKAGTGRLVLRGAGSYTGGTTVSAGTLAVTNGGGLGTGSVTVGAGAVLRYLPAADVPLAIGGTLGLAGTSTLGVAVGAGESSAAVNVTGAASASGAVSLQLAGVPGTAPATGTYTVVQGGAGSNLAAATYTLPVVFNNTNFTVGPPSATATAVTVPITSATPLATAFWRGGLAGYTNLWAASNGSTAANWSLTSGGAAQALVPGASTDVVIIGTGATTNPNNTLLGADMTVRGITFQTAAQTTVNADGSMLTVGAGGLTVATTGDHTYLSVDVSLAEPQTWSNARTDRNFHIRGDVFTNGNDLAVSAAGQVLMEGRITGTGGLSKSGTSTLTLSGYNAFTGPLTITDGTVLVSGTGVLGAGDYSQAITITGGTFNYQSSANQVLSGLISGSGALTKAGSAAGVLTLSGDNFYSGLTSVNAGRLVFAGADNSLAIGGITVGNTGVAQFNSPGSINGTSRNVTVNSGGTVLFGPAFGSENVLSTLITRIVASSAGAIAADNVADADFDFSGTGAGFSGNISLGAVGDVSFTGTLTPNGTTYRLGGGGGTLRLPAANFITGTNALTTVGTGSTVVLAAANDFTGATTISSGSTLQLGTGTAGQDGSVGSSSIANAGTLSVANAASQTLAIPVTGTGAFVKSGAGQLTFDQPQYTGATTVNGGTLTIPVAMRSTATTTVNGGRLVLAGGNQTLPVNYDLTVNGGTLDLGANQQYVRTLSGTGGTITGSGQLLTSGNAGGTFAGSIAGTQALTKSGGQTLWLTGASDTTGDLTVNGGSLTLSLGGRVTSATGAVAVSQATLGLDNTNQTTNLDRLADTRPLATRSGTVLFTSNTTGAAETIGPLSSVANTGTTTVQFSRSAGDATLTLASWTRGTGSLLFANFGSTSGQRLLLADDGASLTLVNGVVPGVFSYSGGNELLPVTYTAADGFLPVGYGSAPATVSAISTGGVPAAATANYFANGAQTTQAVVAGGQTINSFSSYGTSTTVTFVDPTDTLTIASGNIMSRAGGPANFGTTTTRGAITSGQSELFWFNQSINYSVNAVIKDNASGPVKFVSVMDSGTVTLTAANTFTGGLVVGGGGNLTLNATAGAGTIVIPNAADPATGVVINDATLTSSVAGQIGSANVVTINGRGTLALNGANTLAGIVFNSYGGTSNPTVSGGTLTVTGSIVSTPTNIAVTPTISSALDLATATTLDVTVAASPLGNVVNDGGIGTTLDGLQITSVISGAGNLTKKGSGVLKLTSASSTYAGQLAIEEGVLNVAAVNNVAANGVLGNSVLPVILGGAGGTRGTLQYTGGNVTSTKPFTLATGGSGGFQVDTAATVLTLGGVIDGGGGLVKSGAGTLALSAVNSFSGDTRVDQGTLRLSDRLALQYSPLDTGGAGSVTLSSVTTPRLGGLKGGRDLAAVVTSGYASVTALTLDTVAGTATYTGAIANGASGMTLTKSGVGTQILAGANTYTGATAINGGTLQIGAGGTTGSLSPSSAITNDTRLAFSRSDTLTQGIDFAAVISGQGDVVQRGTGTTLLTGFNMYFGETIVEAGTLAVGPSGQIDFSSGVSIGAGTFAYNNSTNRLALPVSFTGTGGTIAGTGEIGFNGFELVISMGNTLSPGSSPGIFSQTGNQTWATGGNYNWQMYDATGLPGQGYDQMLINGLLDIQPGFNLNLWSLMGVGPDTNGAALNFDDSADGHWVIASASSGLLGVENLSQGIIHVAARNGTAGFTNPFAGSFQLTRGGTIGDTTTNDVVLVYVVPEPGTLLVAAAGIALFCLRRRPRPAGARG